MTTQPVSDFQNILDVLDKSKIDNSYELYIKTKDLSTKFKKFSGKHNKELIKNLTESPIYPYHFLNFIYDIMKELCIDTSIKIDDLSVIDRIVAIIQMRIAMKGSDIVIDDKNINLSDYVETVKKITVPSNINVQKDDFVLTLGFPDLKTENAFEKVLISKINGFKSNSEKENTGLLSDIFVFNILSYIKDISINIDGNVVDFDFKNKTISQKIEIGNRMPSDTLLFVVDKITEHFNEVVKQLMSVTVDDQQYFIELSPTLFI